MRYVQVGHGYRFPSVRKVLGGMPDLTCIGQVVRNQRTTTVPIFADLPSCLDELHPDFVLSLIPAHTTPGIMTTCVERGIPILVQPPPLDNLGDVEVVSKLVDSGLVQVCEYHLYTPEQTARLRAVELGLIGEVSQVNLSSTPAYHAMALIRAFLGVESTHAVVRAHRFGGSPQDTGRVLASVDFGENWGGIYDVTETQSRSSVPMGRLLVRGSRGEINGDQMVRKGANNLITTTYFKRLSTPSTESEEPSSWLNQIILGDQVLWLNPWPPMDWDDDELGVAQFLTAMSAWLRHSAPPPYPLSQGLFDARLSLAISEAVQYNRAVEVTRTS